MKINTKNECKNIIIIFINKNLTLTINKSILKDHFFSICLEDSLRNFLFI